MKNNNKNTKKYTEIWSSIIYSELAPLTRDVTCPKL